MPNVRKGVVNVPETAEFRHSRPEGGHPLAPAPALLLPGAAHEILARSAK